MFLRVANIIEDGRFGGPQRRIITVTEKLKMYGIETIVILPQIDSDIFYEKLVRKDIQRIRLKFHRLTKQKSYLIRFIAFFIPELCSLYKLLKNERIDIVHFNSSRQIKGLIAGKVAGKKVICHLNDVKVPCLINITFKLLTFNLCDAFITAGNRVRNHYLINNYYHKKPITEIQAPVNTLEFNPEYVKKEEKIDRLNGLKIVSIGNINPSKGLEYFIRMSSILYKKNNGLNFIVVGASFDSQKKYFMKLVNLAKNLEVKNMNFYGHSDNIASVLKSTDIYVCSSVSEASPISVWEAMAMEKPIVSTDVGDVARFIKDGENGFVVPIKDPAALAAKVSILIENKKLRKEFGKKSRKIAEEYLDIEVCAHKHAEFYKKVLKLK